MEGILERRQKTKLEPDPTPTLAETSTASSDKQVLESWGRTAVFWRRASRIYFGYKAAQVRAAIRGHPGQAVKDEFWQKHHAWAGAEMYSLAVDLRGFYLKVTCFKHCLCFWSAISPSRMCTAYKLNRVR